MKMFNFGSNTMMSVIWMFSEPRF